MASLLVLGAAAFSFGHRPTRLVRMTAGTPKPFVDLQLPPSELQVCRVITHPAGHSSVDDYACPCW